MNTCTIVCIAALVAYASAQCDDTYGKYLNCIKGKVDADYCGLEAEYGGDYRKLLLECFTQDAAVAKAGQKCFIQPAILDKAFDAEGPLKGCGMCFTIARLIKSLYLNAKPEPLACIRKVITKAVGEEIKLCVQQDQPNFKLPPIPDFDEKGDACRELTLNNTGLYCVADWKLKVCSQAGDGNRVRRSSRADGSATCIGQRKAGGSPIWQKECGIMKECRTDFGQCLDPFSKIEKSACTCIEVKRVEVQKKIDAAAAKFDDIARGTGYDNKEATCNACDGKEGCSGIVKWKTCQCVQTSNELIDSASAPGHPSLRQIIKDALGCASDSDQKLDIDTALKTMCFRVSQSGDQGAAASAQLKIGVSFIKSVFDALVLRVQRFCPGPHCTP
jgi:bacterioferritin-associated ferredoxin